MLQSKNTQLLQPKSSSDIKLQALFSPLQFSQNVLIIQLRSMQISI